MAVKVKTKVWLEIGAGATFCHGKADLLQAVQDTGSITKAAARVRISYRRAWEYIRSIEEKSGIKFVQTSVGGVGGGGSKLTEAGGSLLREYRRAQEVVGRLLDKEIDGFAGST